MFFLLQNPESAAGPQGSSTPKVRDNEAGGLAEAVVPRVLSEEDYQDGLGEAAYGADVREADDSSDDGGGRPSIQLKLVHRSAAVREQEKAKEEEREAARRRIREEIRQALDFTDTNSYTDSEDGNDQEMKDVSQKEEPMDES